MLVTPGSNNRNTLVDNVLSMCRSAPGVKHIVVLSSVMAGHPETQFGSQYGLIEQSVRECGIPFTLLRQSMLMESSLSYSAIARKDKQIRSSLSPTSQFALTAAVDIGRAAAVILADPSPHAGNTYTLTGGVVTMEDVAASYSNALAAPVTYTQVPTNW
jgi:uncharacterized protein YbjT (DUF2867 family)